MLTENVAFSVTKTTLTKLENYLLFCNVSRKTCRSVLLTNILCNHGVQFDHFCRDELSQSVFKIQTFVHISVYFVYILLQHTHEAKVTFSFQNDD